MFIISATNELKAQSEKTARNTVYVELLGNAGLYSVNYDRLLSPSVSGRVGAMFISYGEVGVTLVPVMVNYLRGNNHKVELGVGPVFIIASADFDGFGSLESAGVGGTATFGYRYQPKKRGFNFRVGFTPIVFGGEVFPSGGLSVGFGF
jgi:hypothetical protein